ncbi:MAG: hypothetical protein PHG14_09895 [Desulfobacter postgatei]|uniref:hypothetical protein n=1 Tax=Desulfobacter postgatei TaxID=2293 RepID=UPI0023F4182D|nr:hypothetical protein [Desulfobacter postgatei]MDD4274023.1 hypothetical protein [Desulfobacter postgatei]
MTESDKEKPENTLSEVADSEVIDNEKDGKNPLDCMKFPDGTPTEVQRTIRMMMSSASGAVRPGHPLFEKFTDEHVHKYLDYIQKDDDNAFEL